MAGSSTMAIPEELLEQFERRLGHNATPLLTRPYKQLDYYEADDVAIFFGRQQETQEIGARIGAHRLTLLYGVSGVGKTSPLLAGAVPHLKQAAPPSTAIYVRALDWLEEHTKDTPKPGATP